MPQLKTTLSLSLDVIYHLVEFEVYEQYLHGLFAAAEKFVLIYSSNINSKTQDIAIHIEHRKFTDWVEKNKPDWKLKKMIKNKYPLQSNEEESFADFYIFEKR